MAVANGVKTTDGISLGINIHSRQRNCDLWRNQTPEEHRRERHPDCPLVEVPTPHGRLIDADSVEKQIGYVANLDWNRKVGASGGMFAALEIVEDALTIIESEEAVDNGACSADETSEKVQDE